MAAKHLDLRSGATRGLMAAAIALGVLGLSPIRVAAECDGPVPSFREALATAKRVVIGDVVAVHDGGLLEASTSDGWSSRFTLQIRSTPVGEAQGTLEIDDLPTQPCAAGVQARKGDRIAIAFDATAFEPPIHVNTVAWIRGTAPDFVGVETITTAEVFRLLDLTPPDTSTLSDRKSGDFPIGLFVALVAGAVGAVLSMRRSGHTRQRIHDRRGSRFQRRRAGIAKRWSESPEPTRGLAPLLGSPAAEALQDAGWPRPLTDATARPSNRRKQLVRRTQRPDVHAAA